MKTSANGSAFIAAFEGVVLKAYPDPGTGGEPLTVGVGHTSAAGPPHVTPGMTITREQAFAILAADLAKFETAVSGAIRATLTQAEFDACVSLCFNIGEPHFKGSSVVHLLNAGDRQGAADAFLMWTKAAGRVMSGLVKRRQAERQLFLTGDYGHGTTAIRAGDTGVATGAVLARGQASYEATMALQSDLAAIGYMLATDGDYGAGTEKVVRLFQGEHGLNVDGKAGPATRSAIAAAVKARGAAPAPAPHPLPGQKVEPATAQPSPVAEPPKPAGAGWLINLFRRKG